MGNYIYDIPGYTDKAVRTHADWGYHTEPQKHAYKAYKKEVKGIKCVESGVYKYMCMSNLHFQKLNYDSEYILQIFISQISFWPRGRTLGGTSTINSLVYHRGGRGDYDKWAELGAKGWDYDSVLPYFLKSESFQSPSFRDSSEFICLLFSYHENDNIEI